MTESGIGTVRDARMSGSQTAGAAGGLIELPQFPRNFAASAGFRAHFLLCRGQRIKLGRVFWPDSFGQ